MAMEIRGPMYIRVKLCFEDPPLDTPKCLWYLISTRSCRFISDVCYSIQKRFLDEKESISLTMDDYAVPMEESVHLLQDNDVLRVHRQQKRLKSKKRSRGASDSVQESGKKKKRLTELCKENTNSPLVVTKGQKLNTSSHKCKSASTVPCQLLISPPRLGNVPTLPGSNEGVPHQSEMGVPQLNGDQRLICSGQCLTLDKQLDASSTETMTVRTVKSRTGGVHKRFTTSCSSNNDSDETEEASEKVLTTSISNEQCPCEHDELTAADLAWHSSWDIGTSAEMQVLEHDEGSKTCSAVSSRITGGRKDKFRAVSTVIHVPAGGSVHQYDLLPDLCGLPRVGDRIAFKILEMSSEYSPELSHFKSGVVMCVTPTTNTVRLRYTEDTIQHEKERAVKLASGKFALGCNENEEGTGDWEAEVDLNWNDLQETKLMPAECHP